MRSVRSASGLTPSRVTRGMLTLVAVAGIGAVGRQAAAALLDRWSFNETSGTTLADSVGTHNGTIVPGSGTVSLDGQRATLSGGSNAAYISLGSGILTGRSSATIELWATPLSVQNWSRVFDTGTSLGVTGGAADSYIQWAWTLGSSTGSSQFGWTTNGVRNDQNLASPFVLGQEAAIAVTLLDGAGAGGSTLVRLYVNGLLTRSFDNPAPLSGFTGNVFTLGRSLFPGDMVANASYNEVRIHDTALSAAAIQSDFQQGPNAVPEPGMLALLGTGFLGLGLARRFATSAAATGSRTRASS